MGADGHIRWFRDSSPYINAHRGRTFVAHLGGEALASGRLAELAADLALLDSLGVRLVVAHGARPQVDAALQAQGLTADWHGGLRVTPPEAVDAVVGAMAAAGARLQAALSRGATGRPVQGRRLGVVSGNFVRAKPIGVRDGVDYLNTGACRKVRRGAIRRQLAAGAVVIVPPYGYSPSGEIFNLESARLAMEVAVGIGADKLIYLTEAPGVIDAAGQVVSEIELGALAAQETGQAEASGGKGAGSAAAGSAGSAGQAGGQRGADEAGELGALLEHCRAACEAGVARCHLVSYAADGALLQELFTREGAGTQVVGRSYEQTRDAGTDDVAGILALIEPLEAEGLLVKRSRERIEAEIGSFVVIERDGLLIGCAALHAFGGCGELACLATHPDYREGARGDRLLDAIIARARAAGMQQLFVLTTQSADWFRERGFTELALDALPESRKRFYNYQRNAKALQLSLPEGAAPRRRNNSPLEGECDTA